MANTSNTTNYNIQLPVSPWSLAGKTALVTGGTRGIGRAIAEELARLGASVFVCGRSAEGLQERLEAWKKSSEDDDAGGGNHNFGDKIHGCVCDVSLPESRRNLISQVSQHFSGKLDILINNAGIYKGTPMLEAPMDELSTIFNTNFASAFHLSQLAHPLLKASGDGSIVIISSIAGSLAFNANGGLYCSTKSALNQLTRNFAFEWAKDHIRVNNVAPGFIATDMLESNEPAAVDNPVKQRCPLRRFGEPKEVAYVVAFLCMPCSSYVTGSIFTVDGGLSTHNYALPCFPIES